MFTGREELKYLVLTVLSKSKSPLGSGAIREELKGHNISVSEATVGRILRELDTKGFTERVGYRGRTLTCLGKEQLIQMGIERKRTLSGKELLELLKLTGKEKLLDVLVARRAIERETARLAARHARSSHLEALRGVLEQQVSLVETQKSTAQTDIQFHKLVARAAGNKVLETTVDLIREEGSLTPMMEYIRKRVGSTMVADHQKILAAITAGDEKGAEASMVSHIDNLIGDVERYWEEHWRQ